jgi:hypothetical protein
VDPKRTLKGGAGPLPSQSSPANPLNRPGAAGAPQPPGRRAAPGLSEAIDRLARDVQQLRIDYERFFNGNLPLPPEELRNRVQTQIRTLRNATQATAVDTFRLSDLEARFNSYSELFNRRLRDQEEGRQRHARAGQTAVRRHDPEAGIVFGDRVDPEAAQALYQGLAASPGDAPRFDLDAFQTYLARQVASIREKTGCAEVQFRLATEEGKVKLKARPVPSPKGS